MQGRHYRILFFVLTGLLAAARVLPSSNAAAADTPSDEQLNLAQGLTARGDFEHSLSAWRKALHQMQENKDLPGQLTASLGLADALQKLGQNRLAEEILEKADALAKTSGTEQLLRVRIESSLGTLYMFASDPEDSEGLLTKSLASARLAKNNRVIASALNNLGSLHSYQKHSEQACTEYEEGVSAARDSGDPGLALKIAANLVTCAISTRDWKKAEKWARIIVATSAHAPNTYDKATALLGAGKACVEIFTQNESEKDLRLIAFDAYKQAAQDALEINDNRSLSYALGYEGELYQMEGKSNEALMLTRHAASLAQQLKSPDILFRWQWQIARILNLQRKREPAIVAYRSAVSTLGDIRHDMALHYGNVNYHSSFREAAGAVYFELADLLLQRADDAKTDKEIQDDLIDARDTAEDLKTAELEDYFQDDCANLLKSKITKIETISPTAAVIYIIPLSDRTEILVNLPSGRIERFKAVPTGTELESTATEFRFNLEKRTTEEYLAEATQLYDWLIRPLQGLLDKAGIDTLVFVPDGALRTIPMAALNDGRHFLVEKYAIATTPGLTLMEPKPLTTQKSNLMINGLSDAVQGFAPLDYVPGEVKRLNELYGGGKLMNAQFIQPNVDKEFASESYSIVHIASHGHFDSDANKTFILTYNGRLSLNDLERMIRPSQMRDQPVELLTLSACETAAGDDRAALGLAGIAVKAGARSAFATLWFVNDEASSILVGDFYTNLHNISGISKAKALQLAQIKLLSDPRYDHPCYWAPYQIIGNWL